MPYSLSPSSLSIFLECPRCFYLQMKKNIKRPEGIFPSLPSGMDRILKEHFDSYAVKKELPPVLVKHKIDAELFSDMELLQVWRDWRHGLICKDSSGNVLRGAVDNILVKDKKLIVLDYKTRGFDIKDDTHEHYRAQLDIYNYLLRKNGYDTEDYSYLLFYHPDKIVENIFVFHTNLVKVLVDVRKAEKIWQDALNMLEGPIPKAGKCDYCKYRESKVEPTLLDFQANL